MASLRSLADPAAAPRGPRALWLGALLVPSIFATLAFACVAPFAAVAAWAALTLARRDALFAVVALWLGNQVAGFAFLGYSWSADALSWSAAMLIAAWLAMEAALWAIRRLGTAGVAVRAILGVGAAIAVNQLALWLATFALGSVEGSNLSAITDVVTIDIAWSLGLAAAFAALAATRREVRVAAR